MYEEKVQDAHLSARGKIENKSSRSASGPTLVTRLLADLLPTRFAPGLILSRWRRNVPAESLMTKGFSNATSKVVVSNGNTDNKTYFYHCRDANFKKKSSKVP